MDCRVKPGDDDVCLGQLKTWAARDGARAPAFSAWGSSLRAGPVSWRPYARVGWLPPSRGSCAREGRRKRVVGNDTAPTQQQAKNDRQAIEPPGKRELQSHADDGAQPHADAPCAFTTRSGMVLCCSQRVAIIRRSLLVWHGHKGLIRAVSRSQFESIHSHCC